MKALKIIPSIIVSLIILLGLFYFNATTIIKYLANKSLEENNIQISNINIDNIGLDNSKVSDIKAIFDNNEHFIYLYLDELSLSYDFSELRLKLRTIKINSLHIKQLKTDLEAETKPVYLEKYLPQIWYPIIPFENILINELKIESPEYLKKPIYLQHIHSQKTAEAITLDMDPFIVPVKPTAPQTSNELAIDIKVSLTKEGSLKGKVFTNQDEEALSLEINSEAAKANEQALLNNTFDFYFKLQALYPLFKKSHPAVYIIEHYKRTISFLCIQCCESIGITGNRLAISNLVGLIFFYFS